MFNRPRCRDWMPLATQQLRLRNLIKITGHNIIPANYNNNIKYTIYYSLHYNKNDLPFYISEKLTPNGNGVIDWNEINCPNILKLSTQSICIKVWQHNIPKHNNIEDSLQQQHHYSPTSIWSTSRRDPASQQLLGPGQRIDFSEIGLSPLQQQQHYYYDNRRNENELSLNCNNFLTILMNQKENIDESSTQLLYKNNDNLLFTWGVHFSGLILIRKRNEMKFIQNSLSFKMLGGYFVSASSLTQETMRQQLSLNYQLDNNSIQQQQQQQYEKDYTKKLIAKSCDIVQTYTDTNTSSNSSSNIIKNMKIISCNENHPSSAINHDFQINSPRTSRSCSPVRQLNNKLNLISKNDNIMTLKSPKENNDLLDMLQIRYTNQIFRISEVRKSFQLNKLLKLQETQRTIKQCHEHTKELTEQICMKSAFCLNLQLIVNKGFYYKPKNNPSMGRTLNKLLFQETHIKPEDILKAQEYKRQIETAKFRAKLLLEERNRIQSNCKDLVKKLNELKDNNIEHESELMACYRNLSREKDILNNEQIYLIERKNVLKQNQKALRQRKAQLCSEIKEIYPIEKKYAEKYTISHEYLPNADELTMVSTSGTLRVTPLSLSSALGYVAHVVKMCSIVLNLPLRNPIQHEGSRSRIIDIVKEIPNTSREFPLYSRTFPPPKPVLYAVYLLNQNIAQLNVQANGIMHCDLRSTLSNLLLLLSGPGTMGNFRLHPPNHDEFNNCTETSSSSVDLNVISMPTICSSKPVDMIDIKLSEQRISRSVGSYSDDHLSGTDKSFYNSEPLLPTQSVSVHLTKFSDNGNI